MSSNFKRWLVLAVVSSALFLIVIDMTVLYTALPILTAELQASASQKLWIINAYPLVVSGLLLGCGTLGDKLGHKQMFVGGLVVFGAASLGAAYSPSAAYLIAFRSMLAVGAAMMMPATLSIIRLTFESPKEQSLAIGIWAAVASGGAAFGPVLGGLLLARFWWGSVFLINVPIVLLALALTLALIPKGETHPDRQWDLTGSIQIMIGLVALVFAIKEFGKPAPDVLVALLTLLLGVATLWIFARRQRRMRQPMIDFAIFRNRTFSTAVVSALASAAALIGMQLVFSQRLQLVLGLTPLEAGLVILPLPLAAFVAGPLAGWLMSRMARSAFLVYALALSGIGMGAYAVWYDAHAFVQIACLITIGAGLGATMTAASSAIMNAAPPEKAGMAASVEEVSFELGGVIGITLMGTLLSTVFTAAFIPADGLMLSERARESLDDALAAAKSLPADLADPFIAMSRAAFDQAFVVVLVAATLLLLGAAVFAKRYDRP